MSNPKHSFLPVLIISSAILLPGFAPTLVKAGALPNTHPTRTYQPAFPSTFPSVNGTYSGPTTNPSVNESLERVRRTVGDIKRQYPGASGTAGGNPWSDPTFNKVWRDQSCNRGRYGLATGDTNVYEWNGYRCVPVGGRGY